MNEIEQAVRIVDSYRKGDSSPGRLRAYGGCVESAL